MLNPRQINLIQQLAAYNKWVLGRNLAQQFGVTSRTIRNDIATINLYFNNTIIESDIRHGYKVCYENYIEYSNSLPSSSYQPNQSRSAIILLELLTSAHGISIYHFCESLHISESTLETNLTTIRKLLIKYPKVYLKRRMYILSLEGDEAQIRLLYLELLKEITNQSIINLDLLSSYFKHVDITHINKDILQISKDNNTVLSSTQLPYFLLKLSIAIERISINKPYKSLTHTMQESNSSVILRSIFNLHLSHCSVDTIKDEIIGLSDALDNIVINTSELTTIDKSTFTIEQQVNILINDIYQTFKINFIEDTKFINGLNTHIISLLEHQERIIPVSDSFINDIKQKIPLIFEISCYIGTFLQNNFNIVMNETELSFITLHLGAALERIQNKKLYKVILVYPFNPELSTQLKEKLEQRFMNRITIIETVNIVEETKLQSEKPAFILSIVPLYEELSIPVIQISPFLIPEDEVKITQVLNKLQTKKMESSFRKEIVDLIHPEFIYPSLKLNKREEVIEYMTQKAYEYHKVDKDYSQSVFDRERMSSTSFSCGLAVPHSLSGNYIKESAIGIAILDNPILWGDYKVSVVLLLTVTKEDHKILRTFYDCLNTIIKDPYYFNKLLNVKSYHDLLTLMNT